MGDVHYMPVTAPLSLNGVGRDADNVRSVVVYFNRRLTDGEMRFLSEVLGRTVPLMEGHTDA